MWLICFDHRDHDLSALINLKFNTVTSWSTMMRFSFSSLAPPLTFANVLDIVKNVRSWRTLGQYICSYSPSGLDAIQRQHVSDEACLKAVIELFLSGKGYYKQTSWRAVIWSLYLANETQLADNIRSFAEPVQGRCGELRMHDSDCRGHHDGNFTRPTDVLHNNTCMLNL